MLIEFSLSAACFSCIGTMMACQWWCSIPLKASLAPKGNKSFSRVLSYIASRRKPISMQSNAFLMRSIRLMSVLILFITVLLVNIRIQGRPMNLSSSCPPCKKMFSLNGLLSLQKLVIALANKHYKKKLRLSAVRNLVKPGSKSSFHAILKLFLESQVVWIQSVHRHSTNLQSPDILTFLRQSSRSMRFLPRTSITWMRKGCNGVVFGRLRCKSTSFLRTSAPNTSFAELVTIVECIAANGEYASPGIIFEGKQQYERAWLEVDPNIL